MNVTIKLPERIKEGIISLTEKNNVVDGIKDLVKQELIRKKTKYLFMVRNFEKKYGMKFKEFEQKNKNKKMDYETEKDYFDWDMALTALEDIKEEIKGF
jgi:hypothetical protein